ncbi:O-antigen polysaccharide polymerase Wzy [Ligilactobacillus sp. Marseille-Q7487]|uniref:O-antigen polysaccharide polymerase Wzy n=1 Tax=Ligilactobacillus sp. Marseille-Q7487 TaxID=3022128 RepID=UPI0024A9746F|nr:O-antigen polysaccharide polymerase Wzy [Ligilactobacillus sp. Marseille-Q7487]
MNRINNFKLKKETILLIFLQLIFCIIILSIKDLKILTGILTCSLGLGLLSIRIESGYWISFSSFFIILSYLLHVGNLLVVLYFSYPSSEYIYANNNIMCESLYLVQLFHTFFIIGTIISIKKRVPLKKKKLCKINRENLLMIGIICTVVGIIPKIYIDVNQILLGITEGYRATLSMRYGILSILNQFCLVGILIILFILKNKKIARVILAIIICWEIFTMLSGGRIYSISYIISLVYIYCLRIDRPSTKVVLLGGIGVYVICSVMSIIPLIRKDGSGVDINAFTQLFYVQNSPILSMIAELGSTLKSLVYSIINFPTHNNYGYGSSYWETILSIFPVTEKFTDPKHLTFIYGFLYNPYLGGSWLGEVYYNFSYFGFIFCYFWGRILGSFEKIFLMDDINNEYVNSLLILCFIYPIIVYTRDYFARFATNIQVFAVILCLFIFVRLIFRNKRIKVCQK